MARILEAATVLYGDGLHGGAVQGELDGRVRNADSDEVPMAISRHRERWGAVIRGSGRICQLQAEISVVKIEAVACVLIGRVESSLLYYDANVRRIGRIVD